MQALEHIRMALLSVWEEEEEAWAALVIIALS